MNLQISRRDFFYISNILSLSRLLLTPLIFYSVWQSHLVGISIFGGLAILSDALDGFLARRLNQCSELGKILDPIADKIIIGAVLFALVLSNKTDFPHWAFLAIVIRDSLIVLGNGIVLYRVRIITRANWWGKCTTFFLSVAMILYVVKHVVKLQGQIPFYMLCVGLLFMAISSWTYSQRLVRLLQTRVPPHQQTA